MLELTTVGRKSDEARATMLSLPLQFGESVLVVGSRGGDDKHPTWYLNLVEHPEVEVVLGGKPRETHTSRVAIPAERDRLWPIVTAKYRNSAGDQQKTEREILGVLLEVVAGEGGVGV